MTKENIFCQKKLKISDCIRLVSNPSCLRNNTCDYEAFDNVGDMCLNYICKLFSAKPDEEGWELFQATEPTMEALPDYAIAILVIAGLFVLVGLIYLVYRLIERNGCDCCIDFGFAKIFGRVPAPQTGSLYPQIELGKPE